MNFRSHPALRAMLAITKDFWDAGRNSRRHSWKPSTRLLREFKLELGFVIADGVPSFGQAHVLLPGVAGATPRKDCMILVVRCGRGCGGCGHGCPGCGCGCGRGCGGRGCLMHSCCSCHTGGGRPMLWKDHPGQLKPPCLRGARSFEK